MCFHDLVLDDFMVVLLVIDYLVCPYSPGSMRIYYISTYPLFVFVGLIVLLAMVSHFFVFYLSFSV